MAMVRLFGLTDCNTEGRRTGQILPQMWYIPQLGLGWIRMGGVWGWQLFGSQISDRNYSTSHLGTRLRYKYCNVSLGVKLLIGFFGVDLVPEDHFFGRIIGCGGWGGGSIVVQNWKWLLASCSLGLVYSLTGFPFCCRRDHVSCVSWGWFCISCRWLVGLGNLLGRLRPLDCLWCTWLV